jgi:hypothetical protein
MDWKNIIKYICFVVLIWTIPFLINFIVEKLNGDKGDPMFFTIIFLIVAVNIVFVNIAAESVWWKKIIFALITVTLSISLSVLIARLDIFPFYDPYGILTWIFGNGIFMVILWQIIFRSRILKSK